MNSLCFWGTAVATLTSCGQLTFGGKEDGNKPSESEGRVQILRGLGLTEPVTISYEPAAGCTKSKDGMLQVALKQAAQAGKQSVNVGIAVKGFTSKPQEYTCTQSIDNNGTSGAIGNVFDQCATELLISNQYKPESFDSYTIARTQTDTGAFKYSGSCFVKITALSPEVTGTFSCEELVKTQSAGAPVAFPDTSNTTDISGRFTCRFEK